MVIGCMDILKRMSRTLTEVGPTLVWGGEIFLGVRSTRLLRARAARRMSIQHFFTYHCMVHRYTGTGIPVDRGSRFGTWHVIW